MDQRQFDRYLNFYYLEGSPDEAVDALAYYVKSPGVGDAAATPYVAHFFARVAQENPPTLRQYESLLRSASTEGRSFILRILEQSADEGSRRFLTTARRDPAFENEREQIGRVLEVSSANRPDVLHQDLREVADLDLLWAEFRVTGNKMAVLRIIQVLEWPDRIRSRIEEWLRTKPLPSFLFFHPDQWRKQAIDTLGKVAGIVCDGATNEIANREDLDCLCFLDQLEKRSPRQVEQIHKALPFTLTPDDARHATLRMAATWSLARHARQHELVREICEEDLPMRSNRVRLMLLEILGRACFAIGDFAAARTKLAAYCEANPAHRELRDKFRLAQADARLAHLTRAILDGSSPNRIGVTPDEADTRWCIAATEKATSYRSWLTIRDLVRDSLADRNYVIATWRFTYIRPDRFYVIQEIPWFWEEYAETADVDEWITVGAKHFQNVAGWTAGSGDPQAKLNRFLTVDKYLAIMRRTQPRSVSSHLFANERNLLFEYHLPDVPGFFSFDEIQHCYLREERSGTTHGSYPIPPQSAPLNYAHLQARPGILRLLVNPETVFLVKAQLVVSGPGGNAAPWQVVVEQVFANYNDDFRIEGPRLSPV